MPSVTVPGASSDPTHYPASDDVTVLVPVGSGHGPSAHTLKPHLDLAALTLQPQLPTISTPFDVSDSRFEYPFPDSAPDPEFYEGSSSPAFSGHVTSFSPSPTALEASSSSPPLLSRHESIKVFSPAHPKHQSRISVPSSEARKKWGVGIAAPPPHAQFKPVRVWSLNLSRARRTASKAASEEKGLMPSKTFSARRAVAASLSPGVIKSAPEDLKTSAS